MSTFRGQMWNATVTICRRQQTVNENGKTVTEWTSQTVSGAYLGMKKRQVLNGTVLTDDYSIQNTAKIMGIPYRAVGQTGIKKVEKWNYRCNGCGKWFKEKSEECPICGSSMRSYRKH